jgi:hypothetical protein
MSGLNTPSDLEIIISAINAARDAATDSVNTGLSATDSTDSAKAAADDTRYAVNDSQVDINTNIESLKSTVITNYNTLKSILKENDSNSLSNYINKLIKTNNETLFSDLKTIKNILLSLDSNIIRKNKMNNKLYFGILTFLGIISIRLTRSTLLELKNK